MAAPQVESFQLQAPAPPHVFRLQWPLLYCCRTQQLSARAVNRASLRTPLPPPRPVSLSNAYPNLLIMGVRTYCAATRLCKPKTMTCTCRRRLANGLLKRTASCRQSMMDGPCFGTGCTRELFRFTVRYPPTHICHHLLTCQSLSLTPQLRHNRGRVQQPPRGTATAESQTAPGHTSGIYRQGAALPLLQIRPHCPVISEVVSSRSSPPKLLPMVRALDNSSFGSGIATGQRCQFARSRMSACYLADASCFAAHFPGIRAREQHLERAVGPVAHPL